MSNNSELYREAVGVMPGGVNSPVRAFKSVGAEPVFSTLAKGSKIWDSDGNEYIDYIGSWGPAILGHSHENVVAAVVEAATYGLSFGTATENEIRLAQKVMRFFPGIEMLRLVSSGTEATMSALRLARGYTKRDKVVKFAGCYHGHSDSFLVAAGSGAATLGVPNSPGVTEGAAKDTLIARYNDIGSVEELIANNPGEIAAVILEPVVGNAGVIPPEAGFLQKLRVVTEANGILLIMDEVMTGFRLAPGGAQELYGVQGDLTTLGKVIGGGMPVGAFGGRKEIMEMMAPAGPVYQAGTLSGNPVSVAAGLATLKVIAESGADFYSSLEKKGAMLEAGVREILDKKGLGYQYQRVGSMACLYFCGEPVHNFDDAMKCDTDKFGGYYRKMLEGGVLLPPSQFEAFFIGAEHGEDDICKTIEQIESSL